MPTSPESATKKRKTRHSGWTFRMTRQEPGITQLGLAQHGLLSLVDELLLNIIDHIDSHKALCCLAATCMRFQGLVEPYVWRKLLVLKGTHAQDIARAFDARELRREYVQELSIRYQNECREGIEQLNYSFAFMSKLRHLTIETPCPNNSEWMSNVYFDGWSRVEYPSFLANAALPMPDGLPPSLPVLQSLTLHGHGAGDRKFRLGQTAAIFLHPTLRKITMSCTNFDADGIDTETRLMQLLQTKAKSTPLQSLSLIETNINVSFLYTILSLPKALQELSLCERLYVFPECRPPLDPSLRTSSTQFLDALVLQAKSLRRLTHIGGELKYLPPRETDSHGAEKLRSLVELDTLHLGFESHLYYYLRQNGFPPQLKTLQMLDSAISLNMNSNLLGLSDVVFRSLLTLVTDHLPYNLQSGFKLSLKFSDHFFFRLYSADADELNQFLSMLFIDRHTTYKVVNILRSYNGAFEILRDVFPNGKSFIPPYMYGEDQPEEHIMYTSDRLWRFCGTDFQSIDDDLLRDELRAQNKLLLCKRCVKRGFTLQQCLNLGNGSRCLPCRRAHLSCDYQRDENGNLILATT